MPASVTDKFRKGAPAFSTTLSAQKTSGASSCSLSSASGVPTTTGIDITVGRVDSSGTATPSLKAVYTGTLSGTTVSNLTLVEGTDQTHAAGTPVEITFTAAQWNDAVDGILVEHDQDGTHGAITGSTINLSGAATLASASVTGATTLTGALTLKSYDGWITAPDTWTYASADSTNKTYTFTISGVDRTDVMQAGDRIKLTQTTDKYFIVTKIAFSTDTTVTIYGGTDYSLANATITSPKYSHDKSPIGFPLDPAKWTVTSTSTSDRTTSSSSFVTLTDAITVPIGVWQLSLKAFIGCSVITSNLEQGFVVSLTSSGTTETNTNLTARVSAGVDTGTSSNKSFRANVHVFDLIPVTSATTFTLMGKTTTSSTSGVYGSIVTTVIRAVCSYL